MNKYNARKVTYFGETFDSEKEGKRWLLLRSMEKRGEIRQLRRQVKYELIPRAPAVKLQALNYIADFVYEKDGRTVVEDVKGYKKGPAYQLFTAKKKLMYFRFGILVKEV